MITRSRYCAVVTTRCFGTGDLLYEAYHDEEWGRVVVGDDALFERLSLEAFQSGLSWVTILRKREAFREAFSQFLPATVAEYTPDRVDTLLADASIVRNRMKIEAVISNARALLALQAQGKSLTELVWAHRPASRPRPQIFSEVPASTPESAALSKALKKAGFKFIGPTTAYASMQAAGLVNDHILGCPAGDEIDSLKKAGPVSTPDET